MILSNKSTLRSLFTFAVVASLVGALLLVPGRPAAAASVSTIKVGSHPTGIAVNPSTNKVYAVDYQSNTMYVIDGSTNTLKANVSLGDCQCSPAGVAVDTTTNTIYVADYGNGWITPMNGTTDCACTPAITVQGASTDNAGFVPLSPEGIAVDSIAHIVYVSQDSAPGGILSFDASTRQLIGAFPTGQDYPAALAVNPSADRVYVANYGSNTTSVIQGSTGRIVATISVGYHPYDIAVNPSTNTVYVANYGSDSVSVIDASTNTVKTSIRVGNGPDGIAVNPSTNTVYVADFGSNTTTVIDGSTNTVAGTIAVAGGPTYITVNPSTNTVYVVDNTAGAVSVLMPSGSAVPEFPTGLLAAVALVVLAAATAISRKSSVR